MGGWGVALLAFSDSSSKNELSRFRFLKFLPILNVNRTELELYEIKFIFVESIDVLTPANHS